MKMLHCNVPPYEGSEPFVFFSYAPQDRGIAYPMLERMNQQRVRVWYDNGSMPADVRSKTMVERLRDENIPHGQSSCVNTHCTTPRPI